MLVDGAIVNTTEQNSGATDLKWTPSVDAVQEFKMQTNFFGAEYAQSGGAIIETTHGQVDAQLESKLAQLGNALWTFVMDVSTAQDQDGPDA